MHLYGTSSKQSKLHEEAERSTKYIGWTCLYLVTPAGKVSECVNGEPNMSLECQGVHRSRVYALQCSQLLLVLIHQIRKPGRRRRRRGEGGVNGRVRITK